MAFLIRKAFPEMPTYARYILYSVYISSLLVGWFFGLISGFQYARNYGILSSMGHAGEELAAGYIPIGIVIIILFAVVGRKHITRSN